MSASETRRYGFASTTIEVASDTPGTLIWLDEFLIPAFEIRSGKDADFRVGIRTEAAAYEQAVATRPAHVLRTVACFALDSEVTQAASWPTAAGMFVQDPEHEILYRFAGTKVDVLLSHASSPLRVTAMRVVREIAASRALASAARVQLHAAALEVGGRSLLLAGPKGAGKTTLLTYLAAAAGTPILANDRVLLSRTNDAYEARGVPTIVSMRPETFRLVSRSFEAVPKVERPFALTLRESSAAHALAGGVDGRVGFGLSPAQLARHLGVSLCPSARLAAIAFPQAHPDAEGFVVDRLVPGEAERRLRDARFGLHSGKAGPTVFERFTSCSRSASADEKHLTALAQGVPCYSVTIGARLFANGQAARTVLSTCLDS